MATNPRNLKVIVREPNGSLKQLSFVADKKYVVNDSVQITVQETNGSRIPQDVLLKRKGNDLLIEVNGQPETFEVQDFYSSKALVMPDASFAGPALDLAQAVAESANGAIVWSAAATSGTSWSTLGVIGLGALAAGGGSGGGSSNNPAAINLDTTSPDLSDEDIVASLEGAELANGASVDVDTTLIYTFRFSEDIDPNSLTTSDFSNAGSASISIGEIARVGTGLYTVAVTPTSAGTLTMQLSQGALVQDLAGNSIDTSSAIVDQETLEVVDSTSYVPFESLFISVRGTDASDSFSGVWIDEDRDGEFDVGDTELTVNHVDIQSPGYILTFEHPDVSGEDAILNFYFNNNFYENIFLNSPLGELLPHLKSSQLDGTDDGWTIHYWDARMDLVRVRVGVDNNVDITTTLGELGESSRGINISGFGDDDSVIIDMAAETRVNSSGQLSDVNDEYMGWSYSNDNGGRYISYDLSEGYSNVYIPQLIDGNKFTGFSVGLMNRPYEVWYADNLFSPMNEAPGRLLGGYDFWVFKSTSGNSGNIVYNFAPNAISSSYSTGPGLISGKFAVWVGGTNTSISSTAGPNVTMIVPMIDANTPLPNWWSAFSFNDSPRVLGS